MPDNRLVDEWVEQVSRDLVTFREERVRLYVRETPPWWMPRWAWKRLLRAVLTIETSAQ